MQRRLRAHLDAEFEAAQGYKPNKADWLDGNWAGPEGGARRRRPRRGDTGVDIDAAARRRQDAHHRAGRLQRPQDRRRAISSHRAKAIETGEGIDWATAEALAFGTLLDEGIRCACPARTSVRGTFSQRHSVLIDQKTEERYTPLNHLGPARRTSRCSNSPLSEEAVLGFEYGYSPAEPNTLTLWEAQFGDFANGAQVVIDQFISSGERKWLRMSGLVCCCRTATRARGRSIPRPGSSAICSSAPRTTCRSPTARRRPTTSTSCAASCSASSASR